MDKIDVYTEKAIQMLMVYGPKLLLSIVVLIFGLSFIGSLTDYIRKTMEKRGVEPSVVPFFINLVKWGLKILLLLSVASMMGVETTSFIAVLGAAGLAVGLALQGSLANFAGGVIILMFRPFKKGDYISVQGYEGAVESIDIFATIIKTIDNKKVIIPNGPLAGGPINNFTALETRRVDLAIGIGYNDDIRTAIKVLLEMCKKHPKALKDPQPMVAVKEYGDSSINLTIRVWCNTEDYWEVFFALNEQIKYVLDENNISIPFPQRDVHIFNEK